MGKHTRSVSVVAASALAAVSLAACASASGDPSQASSASPSPTWSNVVSPEPPPPSSGKESTDHEMTMDASWPRPFDPAKPIDFSGVKGVSPAQEKRAEDLVSATLREAPKYADVSAATAAGYRSIGDGFSGHEHYINYAYGRDGKVLDASAPESLVYAVDGNKKTLVSAMYLADGPLDDQLADFGGPLMQWHVHKDLCWGAGADGTPQVKGVLDKNGKCPKGSINAGSDIPMVHVWVAPNKCGPFAAVEGLAEGQAVRTGDKSEDSDAKRADVCHSMEEHPAGN